MNNHINEDIEDIVIGIEVSDVKYKNIKTAIVVDQIKGQEELILESLLRFYKKDKEYLKILSKISNQKTIISLREIDYTVTNYGRDKPIIYKLKDGKNFNLYVDYKRQLRGYSKRSFDPFCRRQRIFLTWDLDNYVPIYIDDSYVEKYKKDDSGIVTTIGQLNFFKWAITNEVIDFCFKNKEKINEEMNNSDLEKSKTKEQQNMNGSIRKRQLSKNNKIVHKEETKVIIQFP